MRNKKRNVSLFATENHSLFASSLLTSLFFLVILSPKSVETFRFTVAFFNQGSIYKYCSVRKDSPMLQQSIRLCLKGGLALFFLLAFCGGNLLLSWWAHAAVQATSYAFPHDTIASGGSTSSDFNGS
jgi:hypothetical protein